MEVLDQISTKSLADQCKEHTLYPWSVQEGVNPLEIVKAEGNYIYTPVAKLLDFSSQLVNMNFGHGHPRMEAAIQKAMTKMSFVFPGAATDIKAELGEKLASIAPENLNKVFYTLSGAEANENAIKMARLFTGREKIVTLYRSYHGATFGAISSGGDPRKLPFSKSLMPGIVHVENPYSYRCPWGTSSPEACRDMALAHMERVIQFEGPETVAAILLEGESGTSGCIKYPKGYWKGVKRIADQYGILTISDEVMSGFGRTGSWFGVSNHDVEPDMITMAKGLTGGYLPLGGVIVHDRIADYFQDKMLPLGLTNSGHPLCLAAANEALNIYMEENLIESGIEAGEYLSSKLEELKSKHDCIGDVRLTGLLGAIELVKDKATKEPMAPFNATSSQMTEMNLVSKSLRDQHIFTLVRWNFIFVAPPLTITKDEIDYAVNAIDNALGQLN